MCNPNQQKTRKITMSSYAAVGNRTYEAPAVLARSGVAAERKEWGIAVLSLVLAIIWFGSAWGFCWVTCHGRISSCATSGPIWGRSVKAVCHP
jgi:hypothetical protein